MSILKKNGTETSIWKHRYCGIALAVLVAVVLTGCGGGQPVSVGGATMTVHTATPTIKPAASPKETAQPEPTPTPLATLPPPYEFPMAAAGLFWPSGIPENFSCPLYISSDGHMILYSTRDDNIVEAQWNGNGYTGVPIAENIAAIPVQKAYLDSGEGTLYCQGNKLYADGRTGPSIIMVNMLDGSRCNIDEYCSFKEPGVVLSGQFQYFNGQILSRLEEVKDGKPVPVNKWAVINIAARNYTVVDLTGFRQKVLPTWQDLAALNVMLVGENRLLAVAQVHNPVAKDATAAPDAKSGFGAYAVELNTSGAVIKGMVPIAGSATPEKLALWDAAMVSASPDGKYLLYSASPQSPAGLFLFDIDRGVEYVILGSGSNNMALAQWGPDGNIYYGTADAAPDQNITLQKTTVDKIIGSK